MDIGILLLLSAPSFISKQICFAENQNSENLKIYKKNYPVKENHEKHKIQKILALQKAEEKIASKKLEGRLKPGSNSLKISRINLTKI